MHCPTCPSLLASLPDPERVRDRLSDLFTEARLLRRLLRLTEAARQERTTEPTERQEVRFAR